MKLIRHSASLILVPHVELVQSAGGVPRKILGPSDPNRYSAGKGMKNSSLTPALIGIMLAFALGTLGLTYLNVQMIRKARSLQDVANRINTVRATLDALARESIAYSQTNPAIDPILVSVGLKPGPITSGSGNRPSNR